MPKLIDVFPTLVEALTARLRLDSLESMAHELETATIDHVTYDDSVDVGYIHLNPVRELSDAEAELLGVRSGMTLRVDTRFFTNIDSDNLDRLTGIEILEPGEIKPELQVYAA